MASILVVTSEKDNFETFAARLNAKTGWSVLWAESGEKGLAYIRDGACQLVIADEGLADMTGLTFANKLVAVNPMINCALVSGLNAKDFHEASEGLGILTKLPPQPGEKDADQLSEIIKKIESLIG